MTASPSMATSPWRPTRDGGDGRVFVFRRDPVSGSWSDSQVLASPEGEIDWGASIVLRGGVAVVGGATRQTVLREDPATLSWARSAFLHRSLHDERDGLPALAFDGASVLVGWPRFDPNHSGQADAFRLDELHVDPLPVSAGQLVTVSLQGGPTTTDVVLLATSLGLQVIDHPCTWSCPSPSASRRRTRADRPAGR